MKISKATFKIGGDVFELEPGATEFKDQLAELYNAKPRSRCDVCGNTDESKFRLYVSSPKDKQGKEWTYVKIICACGAASTLGTFLDNKGYFWKKFVEYVPEGQVAPTPAPVAETVSEDIPF